MVLKIRLIADPKAGFHSRANSPLDAWDAHLLQQHAQGIDDQNLSENDEYNISGDDPANAQTSAGIKNRF